jgi:hypothetical protein
MTLLTPCEFGRVTTLNSYSFEQCALSTTSLISKQVVTYRTCGGICYPGVSTLKTWYLADLSNLPHRSKTCSKHSIKSHHDHLTSRQMEDQHSQHSIQVKLNIIKMKILVRWLKITGLSNATNHKNTNLKHESLDNKLMHATCIY